MKTHKTITVVVQLRTPNTREIRSADVVAYARSALLTERGHLHPSEPMSDTEIYRDRVVVLMP